MTTTFAQTVLAWLLTYALHSTVLLFGAWIVVRSGRLSPAFADVIWKTAMVGGVLTATVQMTLDRRPVGSFALATVAAVAPASPGDGDASVGAGDRTREGVSIAAVQAAPTMTTGEATTAPNSIEGSSRETAPAWTTVLASAWIVVALALVLWYIGRRLVLVGRLGDRRSVEPGELTVLLDTLCRESGVASYVHLSASNAISSPVALGNGEICLPAAALVELDPAQQRAMLAHELAHIVRRDPQWLAFSCVVERAFFFQPLNRLARRGLQESAELCADEWAARQTGGVPLARALVKVAEWIQASPLGVPVAGFAEERSHLTRRVSRLLESGALGAPRSRAAAFVASGAILVVTAAFAPGVDGRATLVEPEAQRATPATPATPPEDVAPAPIVAPTPLVAPAALPRGGSARDRLLVEGAVVDTAIVRAVMERLKDDVADVRRAAASALGRLKHPMSIGALVGALEDEDPEVRRAALDALSNYERGVPAAPIRRLLTSDDKEMRYNAIEILKELRDRESLPIIARMVADADPDVRHYALHALDELEAPIADDLLARAMEDASAEVRETAAQIAGDRQVTAMVPRLVRLLEDRSSSVREQSAHALTEMRTEASHAALKKALTHADANVRRIAVEYFGEERDP